MGKRGKAAGYSRYKRNGDIKTEVMEWTQEDVYILEEKVKQLQNEKISPQENKTISKDVL